MVLTLRKRLRQQMLDNPRSVAPVLWAMRARTAAAHAWSESRKAASWLVRSVEADNDTDDLTALSREHLLWATALATGSEISLVERYADELDRDTALRATLDRATTSHPHGATLDRPIRDGRRIVWYALVRLLRPRLVVETGVHHGIGAAVLCAGLLRNVEEGHPGRCLGTDINPHAGWLVDARCRATGEVAVGDSLATLRRQTGPIDLFIGDSDHTGGDERDEYETVLPLLSDQAMLVSDNAHVTGELAAFSRRHGRRFLFAAEVPANSFYRGGGVGLSFR